MKKRLLLLYLSFYILSSLGAQDSCHLRISLLTCAPGTELYSTFGHTALRVQDQHTHGDYVFNYGTFEFSPDFNMKFIRGKLLYSLSVQDFNEFMYGYQVEGRKVREQVLQMDCKGREKLFAALVENAKEENRYYKYDFLFDNCTTRARDIVAKNAGAPVNFKPIFQEKVPSFRHLIHQYLDEGNEYWSKLGIDILLGAKLDRTPTNEEAMFLPDNLLAGFNTATMKDHPLSAPAQTILPMPPPLKERALFTPTVVFALLLIAVIFLSFIRKKWAVVSLNIFDFLFFFILGLAGVLLLFMWFGTDHVVCRNNYNLLWALPTHVVMAFFTASRRSWPKQYFRIVCWIGIGLLLLWSVLPQQLNPALIPLVFLINYRAWMISKTNRHDRSGNHT